MPSNPAPGQLETIRNFVNTYDAEDDSDRVATPDALQQWFVERDLLEPGHTLTTAEHKRAMAVRTALHQTLMSHHGEPLPPEAPEVLEDASCRARFGLRFSAKGCSHLEPKADGVDGAIGRLLAISENYPQLRSNQNFLQLQDELAGTENRIAVERRRYNQSLQDYNTFIGLFPNNIWAGMAGYKRNDAYFNASPAAQQVPKVDFSGMNK